MERLVGLCRGGQALLEFGCAHTVTLLTVHALLLLEATDYQM